MTRTSFSPSAVNTRDIADLLVTAGWGLKERGKRLVLSKRGEPSITLGPTLARNTWANIAETVGAQMEQLISKKHGRQTVTDAEWRARLRLGAQMERIGLPRKFVIDHAGLTTPYSAGYRPNMVDTMSEEQVLDIYIRPFTKTPTPGAGVTTTPPTPPVPSGTRVTASQPASVAITPTPTPVSNHYPTPPAPRVTTHPVSTTPDDATMIKLMGSIEAAVTQLPKLLPAAEENARRKEQMRELQRRLFTVHTALTEATVTINSAQNLLRTYLAED